MGISLNRIQLFWTQFFLVEWTIQVLEARVNFIPTDEAQVLLPTSVLIAVYIWPREGPSSDRQVQQNTEVSLHPVHTLLTHVNSLGAMKVDAQYTIS